jgi:hypothetical protein
MGLAWQQGPLAPGAVGRFLGRIGDAHRAAWSYLDAWTEVRAVAGFISFEPDLVEVSLDGRRLRLEPAQSVVPHGIDRDLSLDEASPGGRR